MEKIERLCQSFHGLNKRKAVIVGGIVLVFVVLGCIICSSKGQQTNLKKLGLKGNVECVAEYHYSLELQDGILVEEPMRFEDENGVVDYTESFYNKEGMLYKDRVIWDIYMNTDMYMYENGLLKEIRHTFNADREPEFTRFAYNDKKQLIRKTESEDGDITKTIYKYDDKGNMVEFCRKESGEKRYWKRICKFDEKGYNIEVFTYNVDGKLEERRINKFDKQGNRTEKIETTKDEVNRTIIEYDYYEDH